MLFSPLDHNHDPVLNQNRYLPESDVPDPLGNQLQRFRTIHCSGSAFRGFSLTEASFHHDTDPSQPEVSMKQEGTWVRLSIINATDSLLPE
jgi:hypothetical protein